MNLCYFVRETVSHGAVEGLVPSYHISTIRILEMPQFCTDLLRWEIYIDMVWRYSLQWVQFGEQSAGSVGSNFSHLAALWCGDAGTDLAKAHVSPSISHPDYAMSDWTTLNLGQMTRKLCHDDLSGWTSKHWTPGSWATENSKRIPWNYWQNFNCKSANTHLHIRHLTKRQVIQ